MPKALTLPQVFALPGAKEVMLCFFCYCALETTAGLWASSYLTLCGRCLPDGCQLCQPVLYRHHGGAGRLRLFDLEAE